ncbi:hypothetical protein OsI_15911 [Oryza sativa Indica Group]|uniref:Os04g0428300 protein n=3 Tax=Oryza sativa TaxID=4530 RepID=A0A979HK12_ORYSJ|nr:hypothetical protein OsI_15911 [Oryza sativa Indica Group]EEE61009.1 hypothetical protein OsJ_14826 [Oryza sativa Japonica Group]BAF14717.2 Os04g0428300 [Oryza sativa Japonica Group]CAE01617.3 OSJNBa0042L16.3 [Oryza sativa Japonica Group]|eukprot:NP_001052803.2 Os04g0428300 [Oryza sativa Japonica Group]
MSLSRRFLNVIMDSRILGLRSLRRIDLARQKFFNPGPPLNGKGSVANADCEASKMPRIHLPDPIITFRASPKDDDQRRSIQYLPLTESKMLCADQSGRTFLFDAETHHVVTMPSLHKPKEKPLSLFIPSAVSQNMDEEEYDEDYVGTLFVMESSPNMELRYKDQTSDQFEAYTYGQQHKKTSFKYWKCQLLPPPPYLRDPMQMKDVGTYCMDIATHTWSPVGKWMLPLYGKIEYVPELNLWFGFSDKNHLSAADLSNLDSKPQLVGTWKEFDPLEDWDLLQGPQLVNIGSGKFCIARFFNTTRISYYGDDFIDQTFAIITGVEVVPRTYQGNGNGSANGGKDNRIASSNCNGSASNSCNGHGNGNGNGNGGKKKLRMIKHKSKCHTTTDGTFIESVF